MVGCFTVDNSLIDTTWRVRTAPGAPREVNHGKFYLVETGSRPVGSLSLFNSHGVPGFQ